MANAIKIEKAKSSRLRRLPLLPRIGLVVELGGSKISILHSPFLETFLNWRDRGFSVKNLVDTANDEIKEILKNLAMGSDGFDSVYRTENASPDTSTASAPEQKKASKRPASPSMKKKTKAKKKSASKKKPAAARSKVTTRSGSGKTRRK